MANNDITLAGITEILDRIVREREAEVLQRVAEAKQREAEEKKWKAEARSLKRLEAKSKAKLEAQIEKTFKGLEELKKQVNGISDSNGKFTEEYFFNSLEKSLIYGGIEFKYIHNGLTRSRKFPNGDIIKGEYDIVMINGDAIAIIEIKYRARKEDILELINRQLPHFKIIFPEYANYTFYLGMASLSFDKETAKEAKKYGVGILRPKGEKLKIEDAHVIPYR